MNTVTLSVLWFPVLEFVLFVGGVFCIIWAIKLILSFFTGG